MITTAEQLAELLPKLAPAARVAVDTEADSLHCYFEKLCLIQLSVAGEDYLVDPLAELDLQPLGKTLATREIVLHGADFDLRLMRRAFGFIASVVFDTVIAARLVGLREFSLAALIERFFGVVLTKGSQKANWARRPLPPHMADYAMNDTHYLLDLAEILEKQLHERGRTEWFRESCQRALDGSSIEREHDPDEAWRIAGSGLLVGRPAAVLRALWHWRDREARATDRPAFHFLQNSELIRAATAFAAGERPDYRHFSPRRRRLFFAAADEALRLPEEELPQPIPRERIGRNRDAEKRVEELKKTRDAAAVELDIDPSLIAPRATLEAIARTPELAEKALMRWQRELLRLDVLA